MTIPVLVPPAAPELSAPYVTPAMFTAYPTWLDLDNLIPGGLAAVETDVLADVLLAASTWAVERCDRMPLHAHWVQGEQQRVRAGHGGRLAIRPRHIPVRAITALSWGCDPTLMTAQPLPDTSMWIEDGRLVSFLPGGGLVQFTGPALQFGSRSSPSALFYVNWSYVAGFPSTTIQGQGGQAVTVADPAGILPGDVLRIYDPGKTEAATVAASYVPAVPTVPATQTSIPLTASLANTHAAGTGITGMPRLMLQAVIAYGVALLMREDVSEEEPVSAFGPAARTTSGSERKGQAAGLVGDAAGWLAKYRPVLRS